MSIVLRQHWQITPNKAHNFTKMASCECFEDIIDDLPQENLYQFVAMVQRARNIFFIDYYGRIKSLLLSTQTSVFSEMKTHGYRFYFVEGRARAAVAHVELGVELEIYKVNDDDTVFDFQVIGTDENGRRRIYDAVQDILVVSLSNVVRAFGSPTYKGLVELHGQGILIGMMEYIYDRYIALSEASTSDEEEE